MNLVKNEERIISYNYISLRGKFIPIMYILPRLIPFRTTHGNHTNITVVYVSGSSKIQTLLSSNVVEITLHGFKLYKSVEKYQIYQIVIMFGFYLNDSHMFYNV